MHASFHVAPRSTSVDVTVALAALLAGKTVSCKAGFVSYAPCSVLPAYRVTPTDTRPSYRVASAHEAIAQLTLSE